MSWWARKSVLLLRSKYRGCQTMVSGQAERTEVKAKETTTSIIWSNLNYKTMVAKKQGLWIRRGKVLNLKQGEELVNRRKKAIKDLKFRRNNRRCSRWITSPKTTSAAQVKHQLSKKREKACWLILQKKDITNKIKIPKCRHRF